VRHSGGLGSRHAIAPVQERKERRNWGIKKRVKSKCRHLIERKKNEEKSDIGEGGSQKG